MQTINEAGLEAIKHHEGLVLRAYRDPVGVWTIGYGHTLTVKEGDVIDVGQAHDLLLSDVVHAEQCVRRLVTVPLTQGQFDALVSFVFNLGCGALIRSTLLKLLNQGLHRRAADEFPRWNQAGGKVLRGLVTRRADERRMFMRKEYV